MKYLIPGFLFFIVLLHPSRLLAQDSRTQYPPLLTKSYFEVNIGYINYPFSEKQLEPGYTVERISVSHIAPRIILGYNFNKYLSAQISYMRPIKWVHYNNVNGEGFNYHIHMNIGGVTMKANIPIKEKFKIYGEGGLGLITRGGSHSNLELEQIIVKDAVIASFLFGAGLKYQANQKWGFMLSTAFSPAHSDPNQPYTVYYSGGFSFNMTPLTSETVEANARSGYIFPHNMIQLGYATNAFGYGVNKLVSEGKIPIFWGGKAEIKQGISIHYQRNAFHGRKYFSLDWGTSFSYWVSRENGDKFWTLSIYPLFRFTLLHLKPFDFYLNYSLAGPTYISGLKIDDYETGPKFTFQDFMGMGCYFGKNRNINAEIRIAHYSNGNLFPHNEGLKIPLTFNLGYTFERK